MNVLRELVQYAMSLVEEEEQEVDEEEEVNHNHSTPQDMNIITGRRRRKMPRCSSPHRPAHC